MNKKKFPAQVYEYITENKARKLGLLAQDIVAKFPGNWTTVEAARSFIRYTLRPKTVSSNIALTEVEKGLLLRYRKGLLHPKPQGRNVLIIGDLHEPFCLEGYLQFNIDLYKKYDITDVIFIGDVIDNHYASYHETDPDGFGAGEELQRAIAKLKRWYEAFPKATVVVGNHDRLIMRKAKTGGIAEKWIRPYNEVLEVYGWNFVESIEIDGVLYVHGEGGTARARIKQELQSTVQGHLHSQAYVEWVVGAKYRVFGVQVGCGIDRKSYALAYSKAGKKPAIGSGVVLENGRLPIVEMMDL